MLRKYQNENGALNNDNCTSFEEEHTSHARRGYLTHTRTRTVSLIYHHQQHYEGFVTAHSWSVSCAHVCVCFLRERQRNVILTRLGTFHEFNLITSIVAIICVKWGQFSCVRVKGSFFYYYILFIFFFFFIRYDL